MGGCRLCVMYIQMVETEVSVLCGEVTQAIAIVPLSPLALAPAPSSPSYSVVIIWLSLKVFLLEEIVQIRVKFQMQINILTAIFADCSKVTFVIITESPGAQSPECPNSPR